jgi:hypothetical protein
MILNQIKNRFKTIAGKSLPIFLILPLLALLAAPAPVAAQSATTIDIVFKADAAWVPAGHYGLSNVSAVFGQTADPELQYVYTATVPASDFPALAADPAVEYAQVDDRVAAAEIIPNDPYFTADDDFDDKQWYLSKIGMPEAWKYGTGSRNVTVAIIDTGIHASHVELNDGRVGAGYDVTRHVNIPAAADSDDNGHGTAVSGIIGAISNNRLGITGINWNVKLMPVKALAADGTGGISAIAAGIVWAADNGADIINLSLGGQGFGGDKVFNDAVRHAYSKNVLIVAAAGNDLVEHGQNLDEKPVYPICADNGQNMILGVAATDVDDHKASFSNFGINCVDIAAPGKKILTTAFLPDEPSNSVLIYGSGTSVATPIVAGVAALLKANNSSLNNFQIRDILKGTADNIDAINATDCLGTSCAGFLGAGRINAAAALSPQPLVNGLLVRKRSNNKIYRIENGMKRPVIDFVFSQRGYNASEVVQEYENQLDQVPTGDPLPPLDGTLLKSPTNDTVYVTVQGITRPVSYFVFTNRNYSFAAVQVISGADLKSLKLGDWYWPTDGTMFTVGSSPTVYIMDNSVRRPVTYYVFLQRHLSFSKVIRITADEFSHIPQAADQYWLPPLDGTLVKSSSSPTVYLIRNAMRNPLSARAFAVRGFRFSSVVTLPQAEVDTIAPGPTILQ